MKKTGWIFLAAVIVVAGVFLADNMKKNVKDSGNILMVTTSCGSFADGRKTGLWLEEFAVPYLAFVKAGYNVTVANPQGGNTPVDPASVGSDTPEDWAPALEMLKKAEKLSSVDPAKFEAVVVPGGHGPLFDLANDKTLAGILTDFDSENKIIAAVCHGPAALTGAVTRGGKALAAGRKMTSFTTKEETLSGLDKEVPFILEEKLKEQGADFLEGDPWSSHVVTDGNLITGQNPQSSAAFAEAVLNALRKK